MIAVKVCHVFDIVNKRTLVERVLENLESLSSVRPPIFVTELENLHFCSGEFR